MQDLTNVELDEIQSKAVEWGCDRKRRVLPITGSAGTGKSMLMRLIYDGLTAKGMNGICCAPTGKAASRIKELTGLPAVTIHRLLEYPMPGEIDEKTGRALSPSFPKRTRMNPLQYDFVLADEYAMVSHEVHRNLFDAMKNGSVIRMFGDVNQLQPVEMNKRLARDPSPFMAAINKFEGVMLRKVYRQGKGSSVLLNCQRVLMGVMPTRSDEFQITFTDSPVKAIENVIYDMKEQGISFATTDNQIITPTNKSWIGTTKLNQLIQCIYHEMHGGYTPERNKWDDSNVSFVVGDKVIITKNDYNLSVFNGEIGVITAIDECGVIDIDFGDRKVSIPPVMDATLPNGVVVQYCPQKDINLAYAITTHKSQGSEFKHVIYVMNKTSLFMCNRRNLYTALSRARLTDHLVTDQRSLSISLSRRDAL